MNIHVELLHYYYIIHSNLSVNDIGNTGASMHLVLYIYYAFAKDKRYTGFATRALTRVYKNKFVALLCT